MSSSSGVVTLSANCYIRVTLLTFFSNLERFPDERFAGFDLTCSNCGNLANYEQKAQSSSCSTLLIHMYVYCILLWLIN